MCKSLLDHIYRIIQQSMLVQEIIYYLMLICLTDVKDLFGFNIVGVNLPDLILFIVELT